MAPCYVLRSIRCRLGLTGQLSRSVANASAWGLLTWNEGFEHLDGGILRAPDSYYSLASRLVRDTVPEEQSSQSRKLNELHLRLGPPPPPDQFAEDSPEFILQVLIAVMKDPSVRSQVAKDVVKHVESEAKRLDARFGPVDDSRDLTGPGVGEDVQLAEVTVSDDQRVLFRKERWEIFLYPDDGCLEAGGEVAGEVVEAGVAVFKDGRNSIRIR